MEPKLLEELRDGYGGMLGLGGRGGVQRWPEMNLETKSCKGHVGYSKESGFTLSSAEEDSINKLKQGCAKSQLISTKFGLATTWRICGWGWE